MVQKPPLSDLAIKSMKPPVRGYVTIWDGTLKGFGVMVSQGGTRSFCVLVASGRRKVIGKYPLMSLADGRKIARAMLAEKVLQKVYPTRTAFEDAKEQFLAHCIEKNKPRTVADYRRLLTRHYRFGRTSLTDITPRAIIACLAPAPMGERHHAFVAGKVFFRWCTRQQLLTRSPMENLAPVPPGRHRKRVLIDTELSAVWHVARAGKTPFHAIVALLILTGQRRSEIASLEWSWISENQIIFPPSITKNGRENTLPVTPQVQELLDALPHLSDRYVFPAAYQKTEKTSVFNGWSKAKTAFDRECEALCRIDPWRLHDIRRTFATGMQRLGVRLEVTENLLNHISGSRGGVVGIYQQFAFVSEKRDALLRWGQFLATLPSAAIMPLRVRTLSHRSSSDAILDHEGRVSEDGP
jgi:integrase